MSADHGDSAPPWFPVTDPDLDAPDGALVWRNGAHYERTGAEWVRVELDDSGRDERPEGCTCGPPDDAWDCAVHDADPSLSGSSTTS